MVPERTLEAEAGLSGNDVFKLGGAASENPGISQGFQGLDFTVGKFPRDGKGFLVVAGWDFVTEEDLPTGAETLALGAANGFDGWRVGVTDLAVDLGAGWEGRPVGVEDRAEDLDGVEDLNEGATAFVEIKVVLEFGVEDFEGLVVEGNVTRTVGVEDLRDPIVEPPAEDGFMLPPEEFSLDDKVESLDASLLLELGCMWISTSCDPQHTNIFHIMYLNVN